MKRAILILALIQYFTLSAFALDIKLAWDPMPAGQTWTAVRIYERVGTVYTQVGQVVPPVATVTLASVTTGTHYYVARSYNGQSESVNSNEVMVTVLTVPGAPTALTITITVQGSQ